MLRTLSQNKQLHAIKSSLNIEQEQHEELVYHYTNGRTSKSSQMTSHECQALINHLNAVKKGTVTDNGRTRTTTMDGKEKMRRKLISICHEMKWRVNGKADVEALNCWLLKFGKYKKVLNQLTEAELPETLTQFENVLKTYYAKR